jgi:hypothetical protein
MIDAEFAAALARLRGPLDFSWIPVQDGGGWYLAKAWSRDPSELDRYDTEAEAQAAADAENADAQTLLDALMARVEEHVPGDYRDGYTREQYETACSVLGATPVSDDDLRRGSSAVILVPEYTHRHVVYAQLCHGRTVGIKAEDQTADDQIAAALDSAGLLRKRMYTREQYEAACQIAGIDPIADDEVATWLSVHYLPPFVDRTPMELRRQTLADHRLAGLRREAKKEGEACDNCDRPIAPGEGMSANLGMACSLGCYQEMS